MNRSPSTTVRRMVLASALLAATVVALIPETPAVRAAPAAIVLAQNAAKSAQDAAREAANAARDAAREAAREAEQAARDAVEESSERRGRGRMSLKIDGIDRQYDSFDQFLDRDPALASMVLGIVFIVFLTPILIIGLIIWYKMRKNRMQNEMMLRLAEKGIVAPAEAMHAIGTGRVEAAVNAARTSGLPLAEQAQIINKRAAWSDLRKGVVMFTIGLAFTFHGVIEEASASWLGLVLLFVGIGYIVLWAFEDRQASAMTAPRTAANVPVRGPGDTTN